VTNENAELIASIILAEIRKPCFTPGGWRTWYRHDGHGVVDGFIRAIGGIGNEQGIVRSFALVRDQLVAKGIIELADGAVRLTEQGRAMLATVPA
jgi:hypothetical protein